MKFLVDSQLPSALARFLASRGVQCQHVLDLDLGAATDAAIWEYARQNDCLYLANIPSARARLIRVRFGNCRTKALLAAVDRLWPKIEAGRKAGDRIVELR